MSQLHDIARTLTSNGRGILAADESIRTMSTRLEDAGITGDEEHRRAYRQVLITTPSLDEYVSGVILCDETFRQEFDGVPVPRVCSDYGLLTGIKVDTGTSQLPGHEGATVTEGLDGLGARLAEYASQGAHFAKWRAVIDPATATGYTNRANASALARYAALCQQHGLVPIVEPEVLCGTGDHDLDAGRRATEDALAAVFAELADAQVDLKGIVLKPNFVTPGLQATEQPSPAVVAESTRAVLGRHVPPEVGGIAFLSGGHSTDRACAFLAGLNDGSTRMPWPTTFSFGRALVSAALTTWGGRPDQVAQAQEVLAENCRTAAAAARGVTPTAGARR